MSHSKRPIPTNLIMGFLGVGKTTAILDLLRHKPADERWAVLVNEFGEVGIDGAILDMDGAHVREVPGGCMCCAAGLPMQIGLNQLIHRARPDRLLIEPTGLGHPSRILETLTAEHYQDVLALGPVLTLVDPRKLEDPRVLDNVQFRDQIAAADVLVANKSDLCSEPQLAHFDQWAAALSPAKRNVFHTRHGQLSPGWLMGETGKGERPVSTPHAHAHVPAGQAGNEAEVPSVADQPWQRVSNEGQGCFSLGWRIAPDHQFDENRIIALAGDDALLRFKAVLNTPEGWRVINMIDGALSAVETEPRAMNRLELISTERPDGDRWDQALAQALAGAQA